MSLLARVPALALFGLAVLISALGGITATAVDPSWGESPYLAAVALLLAGPALAALVIQRRSIRIAIVAPLGALVSLLGVFPELRHLAAAALAGGLSSAFTADIIARVALEPVTPLLATALLIAGALLIAKAIAPARTARWSQVRRVSAVAICVLGVSSLIGSGLGRFGVPACDTGPCGSPWLAIGVVGIGLGLLMVNRLRRDRRDPIGRSAEALPAFIAVVGISITLTVWQALVLEERANMGREMQVASERLAIRLETGLQAMSLRLEEVAAHAAEAGGIGGHAADLHTVSLLIPSSAFLLAVEVDRLGRIGQTYPASADSLVGRPMGDIDPELAYLIPAGRAIAQSAVKHLVLNDRPAIGHYAPIYDGRAFRGGLVLFADKQELLEYYVSSRGRGDFAFRLESNGWVFHSKQDGSPEFADLSGWTGSLPLLGKVRIQASPASRGTNLTSVLPETVLILGIALSLLFAGLQWLTAVARRRSEEVRREASRRVRSDARFGALMQQAVTGVFITEGDRFAFVNERLAEIVGVSSADLLEFEDFVALVHPEDRALLLNRRERRLGGTLVGPFTIRVRHGDDYRYLQINASLASSGENSPVVVGTALDVTESVVAEERLARNEAYFRMLIENSNDLINVIDYEGNIIYINPSIRRLLGFNPQEVIGRSYAEFTHPDDLKGATSAIVANRNSPGQPETRVVRLRHRDGTWRTFQMVGRATRDPEGREVIVVHAHDISDYLAMVGEIERSEKRFRALIENDPAVVAVLDSVGQVIYASPSAEDVWGVPVEDMIGKHSHLFVHPDDFEHYRVALDQAIENPRRLVPLNIRVVRADGSVRVLGGTVLNMLDDSSVHGLVVNFSDITDRVVADKAVAASERRFRALIENGSDLICVTDADGELEYVSPSALPILGYAPEACIGRKVEEFVAPHDRDSVVRIRELPRQGLTERRQEVVALHANGEERILEVVSAPFREEPGSLKRVLTARDVTEQRRAVRQLLLSEARYRHIFRSSPEALIAVDDHGRIREANPIALEIFGRSEDDVIGHLVNEFVLRDDAPRLIETLGEVLGGWPEKLSVTIERPGGGRRLVELSASPLLDDSGRPAVIMIGKDVTVDREREERLRRAEALASLGTMLGGVAHEINNPLQAIGGLSELLIEGYGGVDHIRQIAQEAKRASVLVQNFLRYTRGAQEPGGHEEAVDVIGLLKSVVESEVCPIRASGVSVEYEFEAADLFVYSERVKLEQIFINLITNSCQAMQYEPGARTLTLRARRSDGGVEIEVSDTGCGIPEDDRARVFDPFFTTKDVGEGTGLGLNLVHNLVTEMGGEVGLRSEVGVGATFSIWLPAADGGIASRGEGPEFSKPQSAPRSLRILLVDDEEGIRMGFGQYLRLRGHKVHEASRASLAIEHLRTHASEVDVILSDVRMPGMTADAFLDELERDIPSHRHRVFFMTGGSASPDIRQFLATHGLPHIYKPFSVVEGAARLEMFAEQILSEEDLYTGVS